MKKMKKTGALLLAAVVLCTGCGQSNAKSGETVNETTDQSVYENSVKISLSDEEITVDDERISTEADAAVYMAKDIVYYEEGKDFTYGEGTKEDEHTSEEAAAHTVVHITEPGIYELSGHLSAGQVAVDLGENAEDDPEAVVTLVLNNVDIECTVAPAVIFYNVYECGSKDTETADNQVDTSTAGANVMIADGTENNISGSYVAKIYKSVELNEEGTEVVDSKKLHKYDGAFYSKMSMNVYGGEEDSGVLNINAQNEGLDSELHLTINGGNINIVSGNDGINTNEDGVSVTTINGGTLNIRVNGSTGEGDGIDSNGWLVINGGTVIAEACSVSGDAGIDSDLGIHINGGTVIASGNMLDAISESDQNYVVMSFAERQTGGQTYTLKNEEDQIVAECTPENNFTYLVFSNADLVEGTYTVWMGDTQLSAVSGGDRMPGDGRNGMKDRSKGMTPPEIQENENRPEGMGQPPEDPVSDSETNTVLTITAGGNYFSSVIADQ